MATADPSRHGLLRRRLAVVALCAASVAASAGLRDPSTDEHTVAAAPAESPLADTARFLAGKSAEARTSSYAEYAAQLETGWKQFQEPNLERMRTWWTGHGPASYANVFYPFSGPDIGNALAFFPDADSYLLFGLEDPGVIPDLKGLDDEAITAGLNDLKASLGTILQVNYFFTRAMEKKLGKGSFNSVGSLLVFFLARSDYEVTSARSVAIDRGGELVQKADGGVPGIEITFRRLGGTKQQTLRYFMVNVADRSLAKSSSGFLAYVERQGRFATMIKSASYLMHEGTRGPARFERIRSLILDQSDFVVQDDSGIPLGRFPRDAWKLRFHGSYDAPTAEFAKYLQRDLRVEMQRNSTGKLPFSYGYAFKQGESNLMTAVRAQ